MFEAKNEADLVILNVTLERLDAAVSNDFKAHISQLVDKGATDVILDISGVNFMDSSALGALVSVLKTIEANGRLVIAGASGVVMDLFKLTKMDRVLNLQDTVDAARHHLKSRISLTA